MSEEDRKSTKVYKKDKYDTMMIVLDCGVSMAQEETLGVKSFELGKEIADWIISRKIFTNSKDKINITLIGTEHNMNSDSPHVSLYDEIFRTAQFDHLKFLIKEATLQQNESSVVDGLLTALSNLTEQTNEDPAVEGKSIILISKNCSKLTNVQQEQLNHIGETINKLGIALVYIGDDEGDSSEGMNAVRSFVNRVDGTSYSFQGAGKVLNQFSQPKTSPRAIKKNWEIVPGVKLPLSMYIKTTSAKNPLKRVIVDEQGIELKRQTTYTMQLQQTEVDKSEAVFGYPFGRSKVVIDQEIEKEIYKNHNYNENEERGCMKLIQFTARSNILPSYLIGSNSYIVVPGWDKKTANKDLHLMKTTLSLIEGMLQENTVAICRYAADASKHVHLMALVPRKDENGRLYMIANRIPFFDDWRSYTLQTFENTADTPNNAQLQLIDELIDAMDVTQTGFNNRNIPNPYFQRECATWKMKALAQASDIQEIPPSAFLNMHLQPNASLLEKAKPVFEAFVDTECRSGFNIRPIIKAKRTTKEIVPDSKSHLKGIDIKEEEPNSVGDAQTVIQTIKSESKSQSKLFKMIQKAIDVGGSAMDQVFSGLSMQMQLFEESNLTIVEDFLFARKRFLETDRVKIFNSWLMSLQGNTDYHDFNKYMDEHNLPSLLTFVDSEHSNYNEFDGLIYWSGIVEEKEDKKDFL